MRSFASAALCLAILHASEARVPHSFRDITPRDATPEAQPSSGLFGWLARLLRRDIAPRQNGLCYADDYYTFVGSPSLGEGFCQDYMDYPNRTVPVQATATSTLTTTFTTDVDTMTEYTRVTPSSTLTELITAAGEVKRNANAQITARAVLNRHEAFQLYRRQTNNTDDDNAMESAFSSACDCHDYQGPVVSSTYTDQTTVRTLTAFDDADTTVTLTQTAAPIVATTTTTTVAAPPTRSASTSEELPPAVGSSTIAGSSTTASDPSNPTPTAPAFTCPDDHNATVSQMIGSERYDYLVLCDTILVDPDIYNGVLSYRSFSECVGACSVADQQFDNPVCQGVSFQATDSSGSGNCLLKGVANNTVMAAGIDSALLQGIAVGIFNETVQGTATELLPFASAHATANPEQMNSMVSMMLANSTEAMPMVVPPSAPAVQSGRQVAPITAYSTYISDGSTFSTGTGYRFSTEYPNGSWYETYYTSYSLSWASATIIYGATETGAVVDSSTESNSYQTSGENGQYGIVSWSNTTYFNGSQQDIVQTVSYEANGTPFFSTATTYFTAATGAAGGGGAEGGFGSSVPASTPAGPLVTSTAINNNGSSSGGEQGGGAGSPGSGGSSPVTSTSPLVTQTVIYNSDGTGAASSSFGSGGPPVTYTGVSTLITNGSTAYETYYIISGGPAGTGGASSAEGSDGPSSTPSFSLITAISTAGATGGESDHGASGGPGNTGGASTLVGSGGPSPSPSPPSGPVSLSIVTIISGSGATNGGSSGFGAGGAGGTGVASSTALSGGAASSSVPTVSFSGDLRSGTYSTTTTTTTNVTMPAGTSPLTASFFSDLRSGTISTSSGTAPAPMAPSEGVYIPPGSAPSGSMPLSSSPTASFPGDNRSGTISTESTPMTNGTEVPGTSSPTASFSGDNRSGNISTGSAPTTNGTAPGGTSSPTASFSGDNRSGTIGDSTSSTPPLFTAPSGGVYSPPAGTAPGTAPSETSSPGTAPSGTSPVGTAPPGTSPGTYSVPRDQRSETYGTSSTGTAPTAPAGYVPSGAGPLPSGPAPFPVPTGSAPSGAAPRPTGIPPSGTAPPPIEFSPIDEGEEGEEGGEGEEDEHPPPGFRGPPQGIAPSPEDTEFSSSESGMPGSTGFMLSGYPAPTGTAPSSGFPIPTGTGTSPATFSNTDRPRVPGTKTSGSLSGSGTMPLSTHDYPSMTFPTAQTSCANMTMATTTMFSTTTVYGCYSTCLPSWGAGGGWGGYGGLHAFGGPPAMAEETG